MSFLSPPHEAFSAGFYRDAEFDFAVRGLLGHAACRTSARVTRRLVGGGGGGSVGVAGSGNGAG